MVIDFEFFVEMYIQVNCTWRTISSILKTSRPNTCIQAERHKDLRELLKILNFWLVLSYIPPEALSVALRAARSQGSWECEACTLINEPKAAVCEACGSKRPLPVSFSRLLIQSLPRLWLLKLYITYREGVFNNKSNLLRIYSLLFFKPRRLAYPEFSPDLI